MTDTTDIAALREKYTLVLKDLTDRLAECNRLNYCGDELSAFAAFSSTTIDQLEAERQRADELVLHVNTQANMREKVEAELAELKGEQVPVGFIHHLDVAELKAGGDAEIKPHKTADWQIPVFTAPQKPVVHQDTKRMDWLVSKHVAVRTPLPYGSHEMFVAQCDSEDHEEYHTTLREQVDAAIEAAGGIVKDGE